jgi:hypothetical protein
MYEKPMKDGFWNIVNGGEDQGKAEGGGSFEVPPNPKRSKIKRKETFFQGGILEVNMRSIWKGRILARKSQWQG